MNVTQKYLAELMRATSCTTAYQLHKRLKWTQASISRYKNGKSAFGDRAAEQCAIELGYDPLYIFLQIQAEKAKTLSIKRIYLNAAKRLANRAITAVVVAALGAIGALTFAPDSMSNLALARTPEQAHGQEGNNRQPTNYTHWLVRSWQVVSQRVAAIFNMKVVFA